MTKLIELIDAKKILDEVDKLGEKAGRDIDVLNDYLFDASWELEDAINAKAEEEEEEK